MKIFKNITLVSIALLTVLSSCNNDPLSPGYEFMPDMYRSPSLETYGQNTYFNDSLNARKPVEGTVPRGFVPFDYGIETEEYLRAGLQLKNPLEINEEALAKGKKLFGMFCAHCHGQNGDGAGSINHPVYSAVPSYADDLLIRRSGGTMSELKEGHIYHAIYYGLNAMGPHNSLVNEEERWLITAYVQELQKGNN